MTGTGTMFTPPAEPTVIRGSAAGPATAYLLAEIAAVIIVGGLARSSPLTAGIFALIALILLGGAIFTATGTRVEITPTELTVARRFRPRWSVPLSDFRYVSENIPSRPRMPFLAGWTFRTASGTEAKLEMSMFSPADRRRLRKLFADVLVDADAGLRRW